MSPAERVLYSLLEVGRESGHSREQEGQEGLILQSAGFQKAQKLPNRDRIVDVAGKATAHPEEIEPATCFIPCKIAGV